jgi:RNA polymerase sigma-70 factor (ECF subfamily)
MGIITAQHRPSDLILVTRADQGRSTKRDVPEEGVRRPPGDTAGDGGLDAFLASVERKAYHIGYYALRDEQAALDVVQDSMLKLFEKYAHRPSHEWPALFFTILNHRITDTYRWKRLREAGGKLVSLFRPTGRDQQEENLLDMGVGVELMPDHGRPDRQALGSQLRNRIDNALDRLSDRQRQVFLLREWQGFNVRETAKILGCSEGSVKQHHFRAIRTLRVELNEVWNND